jgi:hypothetical protein
MKSSTGCDFENKVWNRGALADSDSIRFAPDRQRTSQRQIRFQDSDKYGDCRPLHTGLLSWIPVQVSRAFAYWVQKSENPVKSSTFNISKPSESSVSQTPCLTPIGQDGKPQYRAWRPWLWATWICCLIFRSRDDPRPPNHPRPIDFFRDVLAQYELLLWYEDDISAPLRSSANGASRKIPSLGPSKPLPGSIVRRMSPVSTTVIGAVSI